MIKIVGLSELTEYVSGQTEVGFNVIRKRYIYKNPCCAVAYLNGWKEMRAVVVANRDKGIRLCERKDKIDGDVELLKVAKRDIDGNGFRPEKWHKVIAKCSVWMEDNGFYEKQKRISSDTGAMFK
jgi:hypothetical protein